MGKLNVAAMQSKLDNVSKGSGGGSWDSLQSGKNTRRVLWPKGDKEEFWSEGYVHFSLGPEGKTMVTCPKTFNAKNPCPVCEEIERLKKGGKDDKALANKIRQARRIYINVIDRDDEAGDDAIKILPIGVTVLKGLLEIICDPDYGDITDFESGRDVTIKKSGTGLNTEYTVLAKPKETPASEQYTEDELEEKMSDLDGLFKEQSYDELEAILNGEDYESDDDDEDDDDESDDEDDGDESDDYEDWDLGDLQDECMARGIKFSKAQAKSKMKLAALLHEDDEAGGDDYEDAEADSEDDGEEPPFDDDEDEGDEDEEEEEPKKKPAKSSKASGKGSKEDVRAGIKAALNRRKKG